MSQLYENPRIVGRQTLSKRINVWNDSPPRPAKLDEPLIRKKPRSEPPLSLPVENQEAKVTSSSSRPVYTV